MRIVTRNGLDGQDCVSRGVDSLLQLALSLAKDERAAVTLMREAMAEAHRTWDKSDPLERCHHKLQEILTRRSSNGSGHASESLGQNFGDRA